MTTDPFRHTFDQTVKKFVRKFDHTAKKFAGAFGRTANKFWHILSQPADGTLPIRVRRHWTVLLIGLLWIAGGIIADIWLSLLFEVALWYITLGAVLYFAWKALKWWNEVVTVTIDSFRVKKGILGITASTTPNKGTKVRFQKTVVGRMLGYGTLTVESAGQTHGLETIEYLPSQFWPIIDEIPR